MNMWQQHNLKVAEEVEPNRVEKMQGMDVK